MSLPRGPLGQLVSFDGARGLRLDGMLYTAPSAKLTVVHTHGSFGNFYQNKFVPFLSAAFQARNVNFLTFNLSAHDGVCEGYFADGSFSYIGASLVDFETCIDDIVGAVRFAQSLTERVILSGHSLGCDRVVLASMRRGWMHPLMLLAPCDSYALQANLIRPETVEMQRQRLARGPTEDPPIGGSYDWLPLCEYGVRSTSDWTYPNPITRSAFLSVSQGAPYHLFRYKQRPTWRLECQTLVVTPDSDALLTTDPKHVGEFFQSALPSSQHRIIPGDHLFNGKEDHLASCLIGWVEQLHWH
jgi:alpha/beta superfamily hydrolase